MSCSIVVWPTFTLVEAFIHDDDDIEVFVRHAALHQSHTAYTWQTFQNSQWLYIYQILQYRRVARDEYFDISTRLAERVGQGAANIG